MPQSRRRRSAKSELGRIVKQWYAASNANAAAALAAMDAGKPYDGPPHLARVRAEIRKVADQFKANPAEIERLLTFGSGSAPRSGRRSDLDLQGGMLLAVESGYLESDEYRRQMRVLKQLGRLLERNGWPFETEHIPIRNLKVVDAVETAYGKFDGSIILGSEPHPLSRIGFQKVLERTDVPAQMRQEREELRGNKPIRKRDPLKGAGSRAPLKGLNRAAKERADSIAQYLIQRVRDDRRGDTWGWGRRADEAAVRLVKLRYPIAAHGLTAELKHGTLDR